MRFGHCYRGPGWGRDDAGFRGRWGHPGGGRGEPGMGGRQGRRRVFDSGELRLVLLSLIEAEPRHGYDLIRAMEEMTGGAYAPSPGMVYPLLSMMAEMGLVTETAEGARKSFSITEAGRAVLKQTAAETAALRARLGSLSAMREKTDAAPVRRAMFNLRAATISRLSQDGVTRDTILAAAALIDEAAGKIERL